MTADRRNPYLVLGVQHGATREQATTAFAQRSRRARREDGFPYSIDDLTWALNQVEARIGDPVLDLDTYRVPADPEALRPPGGQGLLRMPPIPLPRRTVPSTEQDLLIVRDAAIREAIDDAVIAQAERLLGEHDLFASPSLPSFRGDAPRSRKRWLTIAVLLLLVICAAVVIVALQQGAGDARSELTTSASTTVREEPTPTSTKIGPLVFFAADDYDSSVWAQADLSGVVPGDCFDLDPASTNLAVASVIPCADIHRFEFISAPAIPPEIVLYSDVERAAIDRCTWDFTVYVGTHPNESALSFWYTFPSEENWPLSRDFECWIAAPSDAPLKGQAFQSKV